MTTEMKKLYLNRLEDETGISGTGIVAVGVVLPSGKCVIEWQTKNSSVCVYDSVREVSAIHGHGGKTEIVLESESDAAMLARIQGLREAASAVHCLRPHEAEEIGGNRYVHDIVYPHVLRQFVKDRDAVTDLIPADWRERLQGGVK